MKKTRTRLWSLLLTVAMLLTLLPTTALAREETAEVATRKELQSALENETVSRIVLTGDIEMEDAPWLPVVIDRDLTIDGDNYEIVGLSVTAYALESDGSGIAGTGSSCDYYSGFIGWNKENLTINNLDFSHAEVDIKPLSEKSTGSSILAVVCANNTGTLVYNNVNVVDSVVRGYTKVGILHGFTQGNGSFLANQCSVEDSTVVLEADGTDPESAFSGIIIGYDGNNRAKTNGILLSGNDIVIDDTVDWGEEPVAENGVTKVGSWGLTCDTYTHGRNGTDKVFFAAEVNGYQYETLSDALDVAKNGETVELLKDVTEDVIISEDADITLDLGTYTLTNESSHTIVNNGTLTIIGSGTVDNVTHAKAALYNAPGATVVLNGGNYTRSKENGISSTDNGGNSFYTIQNQGTMTINDDVTVNQGADGNGKYSSLVTIGWYNGKQNTRKENAIMIINGGVFNGGINTIKNDDWGIMEIYDGTIQNSAQHALMNANKGAIYGGTFTTDSTRGAVYAYAQYENTYGLGELTIKGGEFTSNGAAALEAEESSAISITGGTFSSDPSTYVAQGYTALEENGTYRVGKPIIVSFVNEDTMVKTVPVLSGDTVSAPADPVKEGYVFQGWYNGDTKFNASSPVTESGTYTAKWEIETYTVTFDANGGSEVESQQVAYGGSATEPTTIKEGYAFAGWYLNGELYDFTASVTENIVLTAKWNEVVTPDDQPAGVDQIQVAPSIPVIDDNNAPAGSAEVVEALQGGVEQEGVTEAAKDLAFDSAYMAEIAAVAKAELELGDDENVTLVVETSLNISVTDVNDGDSFTLDITPKYTITATAGDKSKVIVENETLTVTEPVTLTIPLPKSFADAAELFVHHLKNNRTYVYDGEVADDKLTFTNPHGFSQFTISRTGPEASVDGVQYATLQEAIDAVENRGTVTVHQSGLYAQVSGVKTFWVETDTGVEMPLLYAAPGYTLSKDGNKYTVRVRTIDDPDNDYELPTWDITVEDSDNGDVEVSPEEAKPTTTITITVTPDKGYAVAEVVVTAENGKEITVTDKGNGKYTFSMPNSDVTIEVTFQPVSGGAAGSDLTITAPTGWVNPFTDVAANAWYYDAVGYANANGLMGGTSATTFAPNGAMNRSMVWTVIARLAGQTISGANWAEDAKAWAVAQGVSDGTNPDGNVTREELVTMLYRYIGSPVMNVPELGLINSYPDAASVSDWAQDAFAWALSRGIIDGRDGKLASGESVTRAEAATILARFHLLTK